MAAQLARRRTVLSSGARHLGWKVGFGTQAAMERMGTAAPLFGFMTDRSLVESGSTVSLAGWTRGVLEPEVAVHLGAHVPAIRVRWRGATTDSLRRVEAGKLAELMQGTSSVAEARDAVAEAVGQGEQQPVVRHARVLERPAHAEVQAAADQHERDVVSLGRLCR